ncbi:MAG: D-glycero-beta-D-manno-heptose 1-phosphate adenylyltransferase [Ignavibacteria bacterium]|nr:D-glycero-beta-D-manno-heptose 1-phosphate adenylyltransferase [Ignavibacteria bacterium]
MGKIIAHNEIAFLCREMKKSGKVIVFTNGCFDILHRGHIEYLSKAKQFGDVLIIGINTDASIKKIKGEKRPIVSEEDRAFVLSSLACVDYVVMFDEETPLNLIAKILPDVLVKGADWNKENIVGKDIVEENGGRVATIEFLPNRSTTNMIERILTLYR